MIWNDVKYRIAQEILNLIGLDVIGETSDDGEADRTAGHVVAPEEPEIPQWTKRRPPFGLAFRPPSGAEVLSIRSGGIRQYISAYVKGLAPKLDEGEVAVYDAKGSIFRFYKDGSVKLTSQSGAVAELTNTGDVVIRPAPGKLVYLATASGTGDPVVTESALNTKLTLVANHQHPETGATTGTSSTLAGLSVTGSSAVLAKYP